jgi:Bifunctional DNA primase/polymerase, N-terminal
MPNIVDSVLDAVCRGFAVFPLKPRDKRPACSGGFRDATGEQPPVRRHWARFPDHNYAIRTGGEFFTLDIDGEEGQRSLSARVGEQRPLRPLPMTVTVITAEGRHLYFKTDGERVATSAGKLGPGLDDRGEGGYTWSVPAASTQADTHTATRRVATRTLSHRIRAAMAA